RAARNCATVCTVFMLSELVFGGGELDCLDRPDIGGDGRRDISLASHEILHETGQATGDREAEHVVRRQNLAIGAAAGADTAHWVRIPAAAGLRRRPPVHGRPPAWRGPGLPRGPGPCSRPVRRPSAASVPCAHTPECRYASGW